VIPGLTASTSFTFDLFVACVYPIALFDFVQQPFYYVDEYTYRLTSQMKPKSGLPKFMSQMWDIERIMLFDDSFLKDPNGFETQLTIESFLGPLIFLLMKSVVVVVFAPFLLVW
jgi:hypothetical protein